jgi:hypothetical protein
MKVGMPVNRAYCRASSGWGWGKRKVRRDLGEILGTARHLSFGCHAKSTEGQGSHQPYRLTDELTDERNSSGIRIVTRACMRFDISFIWEQHSQSRTIAGEILAVVRRQGPRPDAATHLPQTLKDS